MILYTAGHSISGLDTFIELLRRHRVEVLVDIRSTPRSRLAHFDQVPLEEAVESAGIRYRFMGEKLGGKPREAEAASKWRQGKLSDVIVGHLRRTDDWFEGIAELATVIRRADGPVCIMCSEANPNECHRKAVALDVAEAIDGLDIVHIAVSRNAPTEVGVQEVLL